MKVKLNVADRFALGMVLPREANMLDIKAMKPVREVLIPDTKERIELGMIINEQGQPQWDPDRERKQIEVDIDQIVFGIVRTELKKLNDNKKLQEGHMNLWEIFVEKEFDKGK